MRVIALAVAAVVAFGCLVCGSEPAGAADGFKVFKEHCTLFLKSDIVRNGRSFEAADLGRDCGDYYLRGIGMVTVGGQHVSSGVYDYDGNPSASEEALSVMTQDGYDDFAYGTVDVHIPYRGRCDRYRLYANGTISLVGSSRCSRSNPGEKVFKKDCTLDLTVEQDDDGPFFAASDTGPECDEYVVRGASAVTTTGRHSDTGLSDGDQNPSPDEETLHVGIDVSDGGRFAYGTANVYIPYRSRCDKYRLSRDGTVRFTESHPCSG